MTKRGIATAFPGDPRVEVSDLQVRGGVGYGTIDLVSHFENDLSKEVLVVIGQELVNDLGLWKDAETLREKARFLVLQRPGTPQPRAPGGWKVLVLEPFDSGGIDVSSTELREKIRSGVPVDTLMPKNVLAYCKERGLYL
jgi:nicotinate-nucleotide adenylyltransferase